ncbi:MAG: EAL domain-containing protein [Proteobacteria bacterium]|nr:EAL domain-containing protein [Pseudomonadota bacterium]
MLAALEKREREIELSRQALREKERMLTTLMSNLDGMVYRCRNDEHWTMEFVSDGCYHLTGYRPEELLHNSHLSYKGLEHPEDRARVRAEITAALLENRRFFVEYRIQCRDGEIKWVWERGVGIHDEAGNVITLEGFVENVTERKLSTQALQQAERSFRSIFENATEGIFQTSPDGRYLNVNPALAAIYGFSSGAELIASIGDIQHQIYTDPSRRAEFMRLMRETGVVTNFVSEIRRKGGDYIWISENARAVQDEAGNLLFYEGTVEDVTETKLNQEKLEHLANHDPVTGLPNRLLMNDRLRQMMLSAQRSKSIVALVLVDLDHFKLINDTFGHNRGDQLLQTMSHRMLACVREADTVVRLGGDEFVLLLSGAGRGEAMSQVVQRVLQTIARPSQIEGRELSVSCSVGVSIFPRDGRDVQTLLKNADTAMYKAKELGRNNFQFYSPEMNTVITERLEMQSALRSAVEHKQFALLYQPKVNQVTGQIAGMEALLRVKGENGELSLPENFITLAEETGLIVQIGEWVMREACNFNKSLQERGLPPMRVAINLSARQLTRYDLVRAVEQALQHAELSAEYLELELTESMVMHDPEGVIATLAQLQALGIQLSIDDFGTGYSSLSYLKRFPVACLKIDQSFVRELGQDENAAAIVKAIISLGHSLDMKVIAEGVETEKQMSFFLENRCDAMQGFLFSRPLSAGEFALLVERESGGAGKFSLLRQLCANFSADLAHEAAVDITNF